MKRAPARTGSPPRVGGAGAGVAAATALTTGLFASAAFRSFT